jgi:plastocyanin
MRATPLTLLVALVLGASPVLAAEVMVHVGHNKLDPNEVSVAAGTTVVFHNLDEMPGGHTIVAADGTFQSPPLARDQQWSHTFERPGTFRYSIKEHPGTTGTIVVRME